MKRTTITLENIQLKSLDKCKKIADAINTIEVEAGIKVCNIVFDDIFICPWIDLNGLTGTPMRELIKKILIEIREKTKK